MSSQKSTLGQFYTTNNEYILQDLEVPCNERTIIEPFAGQGDLLKNLKSDSYELELYDLDPRCDNIKKRDTLANPPNYNNKFVLTNPPYLARNKSTSKCIYDKYNTNDLYKCFIKELTVNECNGGIIIVPLNFISSTRKSDIELRKAFVEKYHIIRMNIFEEQVFEDTSYTVCSFLFVNMSKQDPTAIHKTLFKIHPSKREIYIELNRDNMYTIGGEIYQLKQSRNIKIGRLTKNNTNSEYATNIVLKCIDDSESKQICIKLVPNDQRYIDNTPNLSARSYATLTIEPKLTTEEQKELVDKFNLYITSKRKQYNSLFLCNYRESSQRFGARKRISFQLAYSVVNYILTNC